MFTYKQQIQTFVQFMDENSKLRNMIETGKGNLQWERDIPAEAFANLQHLAETNFRYSNVCFWFPALNLFLYLLS